MSAVMSVGANRAVICWSCCRSGIDLLSGIFMSGVFVGIWAARVQAIAQQTTHAALRTFRI
jgi:hypothetical protein